MENAKTIAQLLDAVPLSDGDFLVINQPGVLNPITQQYGDTRKITVAQFRKHFTHVGTGIVAFGEIDQYELAKKRWLPLKYQIIEIAGEYQELCDFMWVGPVLNATAPFWYKCDDVDGTRNVNGLYMRVADHRGLFWRVAGQNAVFTAANNTPYDGNSVGTFLKHLTETHTHHIETAIGVEGLAETGYAIPISILSGYGVSGRWTTKASSSQISGKETRPASLSIVVFITF